jgi:hypothetical protein
LPLTKTPPRQNSNKSVIIDEELNDVYDLADNLDTSISNLSSHKKILLYQKLVDETKFVRFEKNKLNKYDFSHPVYHEAGMENIKSLSRHLSQPSFSIMTHTTNTPIKPTKHSRNMKSSQIYSSQDNITQTESPKNRKTKKIKIIKSNKIPSKTSMKIYELYNYNKHKWEPSAKNKCFQIVNNLEQLKSMRTDVLFDLSSKI